MDVPPMFEIFKNHILTQKITESLRREIRMKIKMKEAHWHGREKPFHTEKELEELTRLNSEFSAHAFKMGWDKE